MRQGLDDDIGPQLGAGHLLEGVLYHPDYFAYIGIADLHHGLPHFLGAAFEVFDVQPLHPFFNPADVGFTAAGQNPSLLDQGNQPDGGCASAVNYHGHGGFDFVSGRRAAAAGGGGCVAGAAAAAAAFTQDQLKHLYDFHGVGILQFKDLFNFLFRFGNVQLQNQPFDAHQVVHRINDAHTRRSFIGNCIAVVGCQGCNDLHQTGWAVIGQAKPFFDDLSFVFYSRKGFIRPQRRDRPQSYGSQRTEHDPVFQLFDDNAF